MDEFEIIQRFFARDQHADGVSVGVGDDGAVLTPSAGKNLVAVVDTLIEGRHFLSSMSPADIGWRAVAVNLSDIAAMGAVPRWMTLAVTLGDPDEHWLESFAQGLYDAATASGVSLVGGDTTQGEPAVVTVQVLGEVEHDAELTRSGAQPGDGVFVSGNPGDAAAGLALLMADTAASGALVERFCRPQPRLQLGRELSRFATACIDVSDGLAGDLQKLITASGVGAEVVLESLPVSDALTDFAGDDAREFALQGGDDYELCFSAPEVETDAVLAAAARCGTPVTRIGTVTAGNDLQFRRDGETVTVDTAGYTHFNPES